MSSTPVPTKQDLPKELWRVVTTLSDDAQNAALRKCKELNYDTSRGKITLEETLINLSQARDILLDATEKGKLVQLPLKLQYSLYAQALQAAEDVTALVNGKDAVLNLESDVEELTASIWQFNLHNLSDQVLGFHNKMNQLKSQETRIRQVSRLAEEFVSLQETAKQALGQISDIATAAIAQKATLQTSTEELASILAKGIEQGQKVAGVATQVEQYGTTTAQLLAASKQSAADTEAIAKKSAELQTDIEATRGALHDLTSKTQDLLSSTQSAASSQLSEFDTKYEELSSHTQSNISVLATKLETAATEHTTASNAKIDSATASLLKSGADLENRVSQLIAESSSRQTKEETAHESRLVEQLKDFGLKFRDQVTEQSEIFNVQTTELAGKAEASIKAGDAELRKLTSQLEELEGRIRESIERATEVCPHFCVNGQVLFSGWGAGEGCPFPCPSM